MSLKFVQRTIAFPAVIERILCSPGAFVWGFFWPATRLEHLRSVVLPSIVSARLL